MAVFQSVREIKDAILNHDAEEFFTRYIVGQQTENFNLDKIKFVIEVIAREYGTDVHEDEVVVVGSSKLGFALHSKRKRDERVLPAFRSFGDTSDIDISICSPSLFTILWHEVSAYLHRSKIMPYRQGKLGDYMAYGLSLIHI